MTAPRRLATTRVPKPGAPKPGKSASKPPGKAAPRRAPGKTAPPRSRTARSPLETRALAAQHKAYAPYSDFLVGAAVQMSGQVFEGANVENASYSLGVCAERSAVFAGVLAGAHRLEAVAVSTQASPPSAPCGACRQVLLEFAPDPAQVTVTAINPRGERRSWTLAELIPDGFSARELP